MQGVEVESHRCSFCGDTYSGQTDIVVGGLRDEAICADCLWIAVKVLRRSQARARSQPQRRCLICLREIKVKDLDPCEVEISARDDKWMSTWSAHAACITNAVHPTVQGQWRELGRVNRFRT